MPETTKHLTWTKHTFRCQGCGTLCYISQEAIDSQREAMHDGPEVLDQEVAEGIEYCLKCVAGEHHDGERVTVLHSGHRRTITSTESQQYIDGDPEWLKGAVWELRGLTPDDVRNLDAACGFLEDAPEEWGDTQTTLNKIVALVKAVKEAGVWPQTYDEACDERSYGDPYRDPDEK